MRLLEKPRILLLDGEERPAYYRELREALAAEWRTDRDATGDPQRLRGEIDIALVSDEHSPGLATAVARLVEAGVPTLLLMDGILDWRNTWENPRSLNSERGMPLLQPVLSDKVACLGRMQAAILESWGNVGKCEVVGAPRFDRYLSVRPRTRSAAEPFRLLVMTARTPAFTAEQEKVVTSSLLDLRGWLSRNPRVGSLDLKALWRVAPSLQETLGIAAREIASEPLLQVLTAVDAVVTTPSTVALEAMLVGLPVALLDYTNSPQYLAPAWSITAKEHIDRVVPQLLHADEKRMLFQDTVLHENLACRTPATPRLVTLAQSMIEAGRAARSSGGRVAFPPRILSSEWLNMHEPEPRFELRALYPDHPVFRQRDLAALQARVNQLELESAQLRSSWTWRVGRLATLPIRLARKLLF